MTDITMHTSEGYEIGNWHINDAPSYIINMLQDRYNVRISLFYDDEYTTITKITFPNADIYLRLEYLKSHSFGDVLNCIDKWTGED